MRLDVIVHGLEWDVGKCAWNYLSAVASMRTISQQSSGRVLDRLAESGVEGNKQRKRVQALTRDDMRGTTSQMLLDPAPPLKQVSLEAFCVMRLE